ncbi:MAG: transaldolase [Spirochaetales bacterium]|nr:transaldolase [Spirochaetales bacterium]
MNALEQLSKMTVIVADTGDIQSIKQFQPRDATTNPSLLLAAARQPEYKDLVQKAIDTSGVTDRSSPAGLKAILENLSVVFATEILKIVSGRVSVEVDASLSFDTQATIGYAKRLITRFEEQNISRERILIKIASTWEGIEAAKVLEKEGIHCNLTLLFNLGQAIACAEGGIKLISPFVGRIYDFYKAKQGVESFAPEEDPGVLSVQEIYNYYKKFGYETEVMGASFRTSGEIIELAGCDLLTIGPKFLEEMKNSDTVVEEKLSLEKALARDGEKIVMDESTFRWMLNEDEMATAKLSEGIRRFNADWLKLADYLQEEFL